MVNTKHNICGDPGLCCPFEAKPRQVFASFDSLIVFTIRSDAYISRSDDFHTDNDSNDRRANGLLSPFMHAHGVKCFFTVSCRRGQGLVHLYIKFNTMTILKCALFL